MENVMVGFVFERTEMEKGTQWMCDMGLSKTNLRFFFLENCSWTLWPDGIWAVLSQGFYFPQQKRKKNDLWFSDYVFCQKAISIDILHLIQN